ncbi:MAG TPA: hypothetical protein VK638_37015 [Edaphobacter sp.]|nr:hypothetical protein [Edaphobacter sp.]
MLFDYSRCMGDGRVAKIVSGLEHTHHLGNAAGSDGTSPTPGEIADQIKRIAQSDRFRNSGPITKMLLFLGEQTRKGDGLPVKEYQIATEALDRGPDFDPRVDSTVRTLATRLRDRLDSYYGRGGLADRVIIDLPKGSYVLTASYREPVVSPTPLATAAPTSPAVPSPENPPPAPRRIFPVGQLLRNGVALFVVAVSAFLLGRASRPSPSKDVPTTAESFWACALGNQPSLIIYSNPVFSGVLEDSIRLESSSKPDSKATINIFSGTGEVEAVQLLTQQLDALGDASGIQRSGLFGWDEALSHNLIFIGGPAQSTPYEQLPQLEKFALKSRTDPPFLAQGAVRNQRPEGSEPSFYVQTPGVDYGTNGVVYAIVALTPGPSAHHKVLILAGTNTYGTEAAARFVCDPEQLKTLYAKLGIQLNAPVPPFEALLQAEVRGGVPIESSLVAVHKRTL